jgi:isopenicillin-N N-acyltransferase like protein
MRPSEATPGEALLLRGGPYERGRAQAALCPDLVGHVRHAIAHRLEETGAALESDEAAAFLAAQREAAARLHPEILEEIRGIADGFDLAPETVFRYLHCSTLADLAALPEHEPEGCTAFAVTGSDGALVCKNRDYRPEHVAIQKVMRHADPAWAGREILVIGSLGSPGNFSSGMNSDGFALADTASRTTDLGPGYHRFFLMTKLLVACRTVDEALALIRRLPNTGSGLLLLGDAAGAVAAVEIGHRRVGFEQLSSGRVGRSNHFVTPLMAPSNLRVPDNEASGVNSALRYPRLRAVLQALPEPPGTDDAGAVLALHDPDGRAAFCRHGGPDLSVTIAGAIWDTGRRRLVRAAGNPCSAPWQSFDLEATRARRVA